MKSVPKPWRITALKSNEYFSSSRSFATREAALKHTVDNWYRAFSYTWAVLYYRERPVQLWEDEKCVYEAEDIERLGAQP